MQSSKTSLKVKHNALKRIYKECVSYNKEASQDEAKLAKLKADGKDEHDIKQMAQVLEETKAMVYNSRTRFDTWYDELADMVGQITDPKTMEENDYKDAKKTIEDLSSFRKGNVIA